MPDVVDQEVVVDEKSTVDADVKVEDVEEVKDDASETEPESTDDAGDKKPEDDDHVEHKSNRVQKRIDKLTRDKWELKGRLEMLEKMLDQQAKAKPETTDKPARANFENDEEYVSALTDWTVNQRLSNVKKEINQHQTNSQMDISWNQKVTEAQKAYADYDDVMEDAQDIAIPDHLQASINEALKSSDLGADIVYYLAKNPDEATRIFGMTANAAIRELGKIESKIEVAKVAKPVVKQTKASAPLQLPKASGSKPKLSPENMSVAEYKAYRNKQLINKKG